MNKDFLKQIPVDEQPVAQKLQSLAEDIQVSPAFQAKLESQLRETHNEKVKPSRGWQSRLLPSLGWAILIIGAVFLLNLALRSLMPKQLPATNETPVPSLPTEQVPAPVIEEPLPTPTGTEYDWRGIKLYLDSSMPAAPAQVGLYETQLERPATLDSVRALAEQFGMNGQIYEMPPELGGSDSTSFLVVDGNQHLNIRSNLYFSYYPDYPRWTSYNMPGQTIDQTEAEILIEDFLRSHSFDFAYKVEYSGLYDGYYALPLTPEGLTIHQNHFSAAGFLFRFDETGLLAVEANLATYSLVDNFEVISADEALQRVLDPNATAGILEGMHAASQPVQIWYRSRPDNQTITVWGWINSVKSAEGGAPLVTFDGYQTIGNLAGLAKSTPNTLVEATGQFQIVDGNRFFNIEDWQNFDGYEDGLQGIIQREDDQTVLVTLDGLKLVLPDAPTDLPLPMENVFVLGVTRGDVLEWKSIDTRMQGGGGGGGGGGGSGFYKPNLTGTPVPLPESQDTSSGSGDYIVQEGDTLSGIAETYGITVDELMQANGFTEATIFIGQMLLIPGVQEEQSLIGQKLEGQRGELLVNIVNKLDGSQEVDYALLVLSDQFSLVKLEGENLEPLQSYPHRPVEVWGTIDRYETVIGWGEMPILAVDRYEIPYPDLQFQILQGTLSYISSQGESIALLTTSDGQIYAHRSSPGGLPGQEGDQIQVEALVSPDETIAGYPSIQVFGASLAINPKNGQPIEMQITADQPSVINEADYPGVSSEITATVESVELVYFTPNQRYNVPDPTAGPVYIQPAWRFQGHYWDGSEFEILVQALKDEFLLPEVETVEPPG